MYLVAVNLTLVTGFDIFDAIGFHCEPIIPLSHDFLGESVSVHVRSTNPFMDLDNEGFSFLLGDASHESCREGFFVQGITV